MEPGQTRPSAAQLTRQRPVPSQHFDKSDIYPYSHTFYYDQGLREDRSEDGLEVGSHPEQPSVRGGRLKVTDNGGRVSSC
jgi:hypothetical protein